MSKWLNLKCIECNNEDGYVLDDVEYEKYIELAKEDGVKSVCSKCGGEMILFNYARHSRWRFMD